jgi:hypothetical protein
MLQARRLTAPLNAVLALLLVGAPAPAESSAARYRTAWLFNKGSFKRQAGGGWVEQNAKYRNHFREVARTEHYVGLHDTGRNIQVRLYHRWAYWWTPQAQRWAFLTSGSWQDPRKRPLDEDTFPDERGKLSTPTERKAFPHLGEQYEVLGPATRLYNCVAWTVGVTNQWVWPAKPGKKPTVRDFDELYRRHGYRRVKGLNFDLQPGHDKIVLYGKRSGKVWEPTHGARQLADGSWSSKLGLLPLIRHLEPEDLGGASYGVPIAVYTRPKRTARR